MTNIQCGAGVRDDAPNAVLLSKTPPRFVPRRIPYNRTMAIHESQSLRRLLLTHEIAFVILVVISGALGGTWAYFWQSSSAEAIRLNGLVHTAQEIRSLLYKQIQDVSRAGLRGDAEVRELNSDYSTQIQELFNQLRRLSENRGEDYAVQNMQTAFGLLQANLRNMLDDPFELNRLVRSRFLDPAFEHDFVHDFEDAFESFKGLIALESEAQNRLMARWTRLAPYGLAIPIVFGIALLLFSRHSLTRGFVTPMQSIMDGTRALSAGDLSRVLPAEGVAEVRELAQGINQMAAQLDVSRRKLVAQEKTAALGALVPVVAHNIRNPLASIRANAQLLDGSETAAELSEIRADLIETVDRLGRWVTALVSYLHPLQPQLRAVSVTQSVAATLNLLQPRLASNNVSVRHQRWDEQAQILADPDLLEQAIYGLINNAIEASCAQSSIDLSVAAEADSVVLTITDTAGGLPFQPEPSDLSPGPSTKRFGTGLGIPVAFKICAEHDFELSFDIEPGQGTKVTIRAPQAEAENQ